MQVQIKIVIELKLQIFMIACGMQRLIAKCDKHDRDERKHLLLQDIKYNISAIF
jgi:hypothetical protein